MLFLLLTVISSTFIFVLFKLFPLFKINSLSAIVINYLTASIIGFTINSNYSALPRLFNFNWAFFAVFMGILLFANFIMIQYSTQNIGISITTIACKMSVVIPITFSIIYANEQISRYKIIFLLLAILSIFLLVNREKNKQNANRTRLIILLPLFLFIALGISDSLVKLFQNEYMKPENSSLFTSSLFSFSFITSVLVGLTQKKFIKNIFMLKNIIGGFFLGLANYGSLFYLLKALNYSGVDSSVVFGIVNLGIILFSVLIGLFVFAEKMMKVNWVGVGIAIISIIIFIFANE